MTSPPSGCQKDFHPRTVEHARHTKKAEGRSLPPSEDELVLILTYLTQSVTPVWLVLPPMVTSTGTEIGVPPVEA